MLYSFNCPKCSHNFDVVKPCAERNDPEICEKCSTVAVREFVPRNFAFAGLAPDEASFQPAFGKVVKNKRELRYLAEKNGMVQIGNDYKSPDKLHDEMDKRRTEKAEQNYRDAMRDIEKNGIPT